MSAAKRPIVLIHGLWMTPRSWDNWADYFRGQGHDVIAPAWPGIGDRRPADVRSDPKALRNIGLEEIADYYEGIIHSLPEKPIIMGHSFGGVLMQMLADRGLGAAYVGVEPGPTAGLPVIPFSTAWSGLDVLANPFRARGTTAISKRKFHYNFANDLTRAESDRVWEESAIDSYNRVLFEGVSSLFNQRHGVTAVDYSRKERNPMLVIIGEADHVVPPAIGRALVAKYRSAGGGRVDYKSFASRTHRILSQDGWQEVAEYALEWAIDSAA